MRDDGDSFIAFDTRTGKRVTLIKRAMASGATPADTLKAWPNPNTFNAVLARQEAERMAKADDDGDHDAGDRGDGSGLANHPVVHLATLLIGSGKFANYGDAFHHLLNTSSGAALLHRTRTHKAKDTTMSTSEHLDAIMKRFGPVQFAKHIVETGKSPCSEHELTAALTKAASEQHPELSPAQAFAKLYENASVWQAIAIAKSMPFQVSLEPLVVGGADTRDLSDESEAIAQLKALGARKWPSASEADQFERALTAPENHKLARRAVPIPPATTSFPFPR
jgi:hypothetical protein